MYDHDDVPVRNPHYLPAWGWANVAPQILGNDFPEPRDLGGYPSCAGSDPEMFFPDKGHVEQVAWAKRICKSCPIIAVCAEEHLPERYGVWGGLSERERREVRRVRRIAERIEPELIA